MFHNVSTEVAFVFLHSMLRGSQERTIRAAHIDSKIIFLLSILSINMGQLIFGECTHTSGDIAYAKYCPLGEIDQV